MFAILYKCSNNSLISLKRKEARSLLIFVLLVLHLITASPSLYAESTNPKISISYKKDLLSIWAKDADLKEVLFELADKTNIYVEIPVFLKKKTITINKSGISLSEGLKDILKNIDHSIIYTSIKNNQPIISRVIVFPKSGKSTKSTGNEIQSAYSKIPPAPPGAKHSMNKAKQSAGKIKAYERRIESLKKKLTKIDENSSQGKTISKAIKRLEQNIEKLESSNP